MINYLKEQGVNINDFIDFEKNKKEGIDIYSLTKYSRKQFYAKCIHTDYHGSYLVSPYFLANSKSIKTLGCPYCMHRKLHPLDTFKYKHADLIEWWDKNKNDRKPNEVGYDEDYMAWFTCPKCKDYSFRRNIKFISLSPFKNHICEDKKKELQLDKFKLDSIRANKRQQENLEKANKGIISKYGGEWHIVEFKGFNRPCIVEHSCGKRREVSRFNNVLNNNLRCECEK